MAGQLLITCSLAHISTVLTSGKGTIAREIGDIHIHLKKDEALVLIIGFVLILVGAVIESIAINSL